MNHADIEKSIRLLINNLYMKMDYRSFLDGSRKLLLVEGQTDKEFINNKICNDIECIVANKAFGSSDGFGNYIEPNSKRSIVQVVFGLSKIPILLKIPKDLEKCTVYGMIDLDYDDADSGFFSTDKLFVTDTHDLETLMLSTDESLLSKIDGCSITTEDFRKVSFLAYYLGVLRKVLYSIDFLKSRSGLRCLSPGAQQQIDYSKFIENDTIDLKSLVEYICFKNMLLSITDEQTVINKVASSPLLKKKIDEDGNWKINWKQFDFQSVDDFWTIVNGHEILNLLRFVNSGVAAKYKNNPDFGLNRELEMEIIHKYNYEKLKNTKMYSDMQKQKVVVSE